MHIIYNAACLDKVVLSQTQLFLAICSTMLKLILRQSALT